MTITKPSTIKNKQKVMLQALRECNALVTHAVKAAKISRSTHYEWMRKYPEYRSAVEELDDFVLDKIENAAMRMIEEGKNPAIIIFYLKTKGKRRGFIEKQEIEHSMGDVTKIRELIKEYDEQELADSDQGD